MGFLFIGYRCSDYPEFLVRMPRILAAVLQTQTAKDIKSDAAAPPAFRSLLLADYIM